MDSAGQEVRKRFQMMMIFAPQHQSQDPHKRSIVSLKLFCADQDDQDSGTMDIVSNAPT